MKKDVSKSITYNKILNAIGKTYGYLTVLCVCGKETTITFYSLGRTTKSCGCVNGSDKRKKHNPLESNIKEAFLFYKKDGYLSLEQFKELASLPCFYCGATPSNITRGSAKNGFRYNNPFIYSGLDRRDNSKGHNYNNCVPCCHQCNSAKSNRTEKEFLDWINRIYKFQLDKNK